MVGGAGSGTFGRQARLFAANTRIAVWACAVAALGFGIFPRIAHADLGRHAAGVESVLAQLDAAFGSWVVAPIASVLFVDIVFWDNGGESDIRLPFIVLWLISGAVFFTFRFSFVNLRAFWHGIMVTTGRYDDPDDPGEVSHFQALSSALSATVGLGNIAGVAVAVGLGGPGAVVWMVVAAFFGMSSKFTECTLGQLYRVVDDHGRVSGGPMRYLQSGLAERGAPQLGRVLAVAFAVLCIGGSIGAGSMFQANQSYAQLADNLSFLQGGLGALGYGVALAGLVGLVIIGGIRRIGTVAGFLVPVMCVVYLAAGISVLIFHAEDMGPALSHMFALAFDWSAGVGGVVGAVVVGFQRAVFSNEAGIGSASIAHSAAATNEPVREGVVALLEPFIDTVVVCSMTGLIVVVSGAYKEPGLEGVAMTSKAFESVLPWFPAVLSFAVFMFAFSTMISWSYYGERCWAFLFGDTRSVVYRYLFLGFMVLGTVLKLGSVIDFADLMILGMAFPNMLGMVLLSGKVREELTSYWAKYKSGAMNGG